VETTLRKLLPGNKDTDPRNLGKGQLKYVGTRAETRFRLSAELTSPFQSTGASVQSTTGSRSVCISGSNAGYTMFRGSVKRTGYPLHSVVSPLTSSSVHHRASPCITVYHRVPSHFNWSLLLLVRDGKTN